MNPLIVWSVFLAVSLHFEYFGPWLVVDTVVYLLGIVKYLASVLLLAFVVDHIGHQIYKRLFWKDQLRRWWFNEDAIPPANLITTVNPAFEQPRKSWCAACSNYTLCYLEDGKHHRDFWGEAPEIEKKPVFRPLRAGDPGWIPPEYRAIQERRYVPRDPVIDEYARTSRLFGGAKYMEARVAAMQAANNRLAERQCMAVTESLASVGPTMTYDFQLLLHNLEGDNWFRSSDEQRRAFFLTVTMYMASAMKDLRVIVPYCHNLPGLQQALQWPWKEMCLVWRKLPDDTLYRDFKCHIREAFFLLGWNQIPYPHQFEGATTWGAAPAHVGAVPSTFGGNYTRSEGQLHGASSPKVWHGGQAVGNLVDRVVPKDTLTDANACSGPSGTIQSVADGGAVQGIRGNQGR